MKGYDGRDAGRALITALAAAALAAQITLSITEARQVPWESATFSGARHVLSVALAGDAGRIDAWLAGLAGLAEANFALSHHIVADIVAVVGDGVTIEALTVAND